MPRFDCGSAWACPDSTTRSYTLRVIVGISRIWLSLTVVEMSWVEVLIWAGFDSDPRYPSIVPHCAFENPECTDPAACRVNVDTRAYAFFDD